MKNHIKGGVKILAGYLITLLIFIVFLYTFISITKDNFVKWMPVYSFIFFLLLYLFTYSDMKRLALKEKKPQYELNPYPVKGLVLGLIGFLPIALIEIVYPFIVHENETVMRFVELAIMAILGPLYWILKLFDKTFLGYAAASLAVPFIAMFGYLAGYYGFDFTKYFKKTRVEKPMEFKKSPWNPTVSKNKSSSKKK